MRRYAIDGDAAAFDEIYRRYAGPLYGFFRRSVGSDHVAQDLVQQTFMHLHRARRDWDPKRALRPWLYTIAINVRRVHVRTLSRRPEAAWDQDLTPEPSIDPSTSSASDRLVRRALDGLPEHQREVVVLHWYEQLSFPEIASIVGSSTSAVKVRAHRAYTHLRATLGDPAISAARERS